MSRARTGIGGVVVLVAAVGEKDVVDHRPTRPGVRGLDYII